MTTKQFCLVTGGSRGIGAAIVSRLATPARTVFFNYKTGEAEALSLCARIRQTGGSVEAIQADLAGRDAVLGMFERIKQETSELHILIHNASEPLTPKRLQHLDWDADVMPQMNVACRGFLDCLQAAHPMLVQGSRIVVLLTDALFHTPPVQMGAYLAAKGALWGLVRAASKELLPRGVTVNAVSPSMTKTNLLRNYADRAVEIMAGDHPQGQLATPDQIASVVEMLAVQPGYLHGANLIVNGGAGF
ncbi:MAG: SDR family oxidoreductase [Acidobacteria bacterium]|nr:SDR family oxidoreductase [Acidobacteriota bacterium]